MRNKHLCRVCGVVNSFSKLSLYALCVPNFLETIHTVHNYSLPQKYQLLRNYSHCSQTVHKLFTAHKRRLGKSHPIKVCELLASRAPEGGRQPEFHPERSTQA